jgi:5-methylcytosine-specific restriction endonuclease McrA
MHRGDEHEIGDRNCRHESAEGRVWNARDALRIVARRAGRTALACVDCGEVVEELRDGRWHALQTAVVEGQTVRTRVPHWEADHEVALEDGGEHTIENLRCRCVPCHRAKTAREAGARADRRCSPVAVLGAGGGL